MSSLLLLTRKSLPFWAFSPSFPRNSGYGREKKSLFFWWFSFLLPEKPGWPRFGSVRFGYGLWMERFKRFRFSVPAVPLLKGFVCALIFFSLPFWKTARKTTKKARISSACRTPKILGKEGEKAQDRKEFLQKEKGKENQKGKEKKIRVFQ